MRPTLSFRIEFEPDPSSASAAIGHWGYDGRPGPDFPHGLSLIGWGYDGPHKAREAALNKSMKLVSVWIWRSLNLSPIIAVDIPTRPVR